jgi:hypothetical protein
MFLIPLPILHFLLLFLPMCWQPWAWHAYHNLDKVEEDLEVEQYLNQHHPNRQNPGKKLKVTRK